MDLFRALSISFFSWFASIICDVTLDRKSSKFAKRCGSSRRSCAHRLRTSAGLMRQNHVLITLLTSVTRTDTPAYKVTQNHTSVAHMRGLADSRDINLPLKISSLQQKL